MKHEWKKIPRVGITQFASLLALIALFHSGCSPSPQADIYPATTKVELELQQVHTWKELYLWEDNFTLGNKSARLVLAIVATQPVEHKDLAAADFYGFFWIAGNRYYWSGNQLLGKEEKRYKEWNSPFLSDLTGRLNRLSEPVTRADVQRVLDELENDIPAATEATTEDTE